MASVGQLRNSLRLWIHRSRQGDELNKKQRRCKLVPKMLWLNQLCLILFSSSAKNL